MKKYVITQRASIDRHGVPIDSLEKGYMDFFRSIGILLIPISNFCVDTSSFLACLNYDGIILSGGGDLSPAHYANPPETPFYYSLERENVHKQLVDDAKRRNVPVFGICYGMQYLCCLFGGKLTHNVHHAERNVRKPGTCHPIASRGNVFDTDGMIVNHYHNSGIRESHVPREMQAFATDRDFDVVEGIIHRKRMIAGTEWHPERDDRSPDVQRELVKTILKHLENR